MVASVHDQPEQRSILVLSGGNSKYHTRFGYCLDTQYTANRLKACNKCYAELIGEMESWNINSDAESIGNFSKWSKHTCEDCVRWNYKIDSPLLTFPPPPNYPTNYDALPSGHIRPKRIKFLYTSISNCNF